MISIIIPAYNCAKTIGDTLGSILNQGYKDFELVVINDGSLDNTEEVLAKYSAGETRIKYFTVPNAGPAIARNFGMGKATGDIFMFVDSDDKLVEGALEWLVAEMSTNPAEVYMFGHIITDSNGEPISNYCYKDAYGPAKEILQKELPGLYRANLLHQIWNKAYRADFIRKNNIQMQDYKFGEDRLFVFEALKNCETIYITQKCLYYYISQPGGSLISNYYNKKFDCCCLIDDKIRLLSIQMNCDKEAADAVWDYMFLKTALSCMTILFHHTCKLTHEEKRQEIKKILLHPQVHHKMRLDRGMGGSIKIISQIMYSKIVWLNMFMGYSIALFMKKNLRGFVNAKHK